MKANCKNCGSEIEYRDSQSAGTFCSNTCQGEMTVRRKFVYGSYFSPAMRRYLLKARGLQCQSLTCHAPYGYVDTNPRAFQIDHVNGDREDNRHHNLKVLCAICHCKTPTWGNGNASKDFPVTENKQIRSDILSVKKIEAIKPRDKVYKVYDRRGLYLQIYPSGKLSWYYKYVFNKKEKRYWIGEYPDVSLQEARDKNNHLRLQKNHGIDPCQAKKNRIMGIYFPEFPTLKRSQI
tara:strand:- start:1588 stop:2292 length:705 start_codon:yes stop_codon:yes gene_type:complete